jgi:hypothetical protein
VKNVGKRMSKITIASVFEISKALATEAGQQLVQPLEFLSDFGEQALRALNNGINFRDNFDGEFKQVELKHGINQIVSVNKSPVDIWVTRTFTSTNFVTSFGWFIDDDNNLTVNASFVGAPTDVVITRLAIVY